ncbi:hypothetical protein E4634_21245 [Mangrovimicrobium sediminis]|uniref:Uncharacterized protein n=1 Tax=Mangrovimicrobium sediminis TaxID=2562682 RepID=A0A4Z0LST5_9GAMM|nr:hypothetical protein [Haliea sp. SAOS-164]TGD70143.1 hypothetical protein E4634_21385 [Haliea sp. SAOS-164]TGD70267.1 hypothetical protein E4634_21245 [Haliea sp. SAOS-164]
MNITLKIFRDKMILMHESRIVTALPKEPYSTTRLLVGTFEPAVACLKEGLSSIGAVGIFKKSPRIFISPQEMCEGGLSEVERRCLTELGLAAGARAVEFVNEKGA